MTFSFTPLARQVAIILCAGGAIAFPATAQENQRQLDRVLRSVEGGGTFTPTIDTGLTLWERTQFDYGGSLAFSYLSLNQAGGNSVSLVQPEADVYGRLNLDGVHGFFVLAQMTYHEFSPDDSFDGRGDRWVEPFLTRYWYEFDLRRAMDVYQHTDIDSNLNLRVGRQFIDWAGGLALSETLYAVKPTIEIDKRNRFEMVVGITPDHVADFDSSRQNYDTQTRRFYFGAMFAHVFERGDELFAYALGMRDRSNEDASRFGGLTGVDFNRDSTYYGLGARGALADQWLYSTELVYQSGWSASDPLFGVQSTEQLKALAGRVQLTYVFRDESETRAQAELLFGSGDADRRSTTDTVGGNRPGTNDNAFNALGYAFTGVAFAPTLSNLVVTRVGVATFPWRTSEDFHELQLGADVLFTFKQKAEGAIDEPTLAKNYLGVETDVYANWRVTSDLSITARYGLFSPGAAIPDTSDYLRHFIYLGVTLSF